MCAAALRLHAHGGRQRCQRRFSMRRRRQRRRAPPSAVRPENSSFRSAQRLHDSSHRPCLTRLRVAGGCPSRDRA
jgi:hypothetical protein